MNLDVDYLRVEGARARIIAESSSAEIISDLNSLNEQMSIE